MCVNCGANADLSAVPYQLAARKDPLHRNMGEVLVGNVPAPIGLAGGVRPIEGPDEIATRT